MNDELSQTDLAKALGLAKSRITAMKREGMPTHSIEAAHAWRKARQNIARRKPAPKPATVMDRPAAPLPMPSAELIRANEVRFDGLETGESHDEARTRREIAEASMAEMKEGEMRGKFVVKAEVDSAVFEIARALRDGLYNCARRIAADVATLSKAEDCEAVIDREHRALLESMACSLTSKLGASTEGAPK